MLGRHNFDRPIDFSSSPSPLIAPSSQNSISSQAESRVPSTPKHVYHGSSFDQNVPSTPFTNLSMPNITAYGLRETDVSNFTPPNLIKSENLSSTSSSRTYDQLVPLTPEGYGQNTSTSISISPTQSQDSVSSKSFQATNNYNSIKTPSFLKSKSKLSIKKNIHEPPGKAGFYITAMKQLDSNTLNSSLLPSSASHAFSTDQFDMNKFKEESTHIFLSNEYSLPGPSSVQSKTPTAISRAEVTDIRRSLLNMQSSSLFNNLATNIDNLFSGDDIFL